MQSQTTRPPSYPTALHPPLDRDSRLLLATISVVLGGTIEVSPAALEFVLRRSIFITSELHAWARISSVFSEIVAKHHLDDFERTDLLQFLTFAVRAGSRARTWEVIPAELMVPSCADEALDILFQDSGR